MKQRCECGCFIYEQEWSIQVCSHCRKPAFIDKEMEKMNDLYGDTK